MKTFDGKEYPPLNSDPALEPLLQKLWEVPLLVKEFLHHKWQEQTFTDYQLSLLQKAREAIESVEKYAKEKKDG